MNSKHWIQMFGAGDVVNWAGGSDTSNAGQMNANNNASEVAYGTLSAEMKTFYDKTLLTLAGANLVHDQFGQRRPIPKNGGKTIEFRKFSKLPKALQPITEGVTPAGNKLNVTAVYATVDQYGDYIEQTDVLEMTSIDNTIVEATKELAAQAGLTLDTVVRNELVGGTNVMYCPSVSGSTETPITSRADITSACKLRVKDVFMAAAKLKAVNAPKINGSYVAIIHPYVAYDLMQEAGDEWIGIQKYANTDNILRGEIGTLGGVRFVESTEAKIFGPGIIRGDYTRVTVAANASSAATSITVNESLTTGSGLSIPVYINGVANVITAIAANSVDNTKSDLTISALSANVSAGAMICGKGAGKDGSAVFATLFLGENAYGVTEITGGGLEHIVKQRGYGNDPLNQRSSVGWKATKVAKRLLDEYLIRVESGGAFSGSAESN